MKKVLMTIYALLIVAGLAIIFSYITFLIKEKKESEALKEKINVEYVDFKNSVQAFSDVRTRLLKEISGIYLEDLDKSHSSIEKTLKEYDVSVQKIQRTSKPLNEASQNLKTMDKDIHNKVSAFKFNYEQSINYYVSDYEKLNEKVKLYNEYLEENAPKKKKITLFKAIIDDYVDFDGNGVLLGAE